MNEYSWIDDQINESYQRGVADGVDDERKRIRKALLDRPVEDVAYREFRQSGDAYLALTAALAAIGLGAKETA